MKTSFDADALIILSHLEVQNANIISSPLTWGFPAVSGALGFVHALERQLVHDYDDLKLGGVGVVCHEFSPQIYRSDSWRDGLFCLTRNPLDKDGASPAMVEEGRANMKISLIIQARGESCKVTEAAGKEIEKNISNIVQTLRFSGGSIISANKYSKLRVHFSDCDTEEENKKILRKLIPGFCLVSREDLLVKRMEELKLTDPESTAIDAFLEFSSLNFKPSTNDLNEKKAEWSVDKKPGWIVPIPVGYGSISELYEPGLVKNARDNSCPFQFVESIYSLGQWISPHRIKDINDIFWHYDVNIDEGLYRCVNDPKNSIENFNFKE